MPETILIRLIAPTLPVGFCPVDYQQEWSEAIALTQAELLVDGVSSFYNIGPTVPAANNRAFPWIRTISGDIDDVYYFSATAGFWLTIPKGIPGPGPNGKRIPYEGTEASLLTLDGGENAPVSLYTGPFWEIDHNYDGRIAMGAGVIPDASPAKTLGVGEDYGAAKHMQTPDQLATHTHQISSQASITHDGVVDVVNSGSGADDGLLIGLTGNLSNALTVGANEYTTAQEAIPIIPPVRGLWMIKRTIRKYARV